MPSSYGLISETRSVQETWTICSTSLNNRKNLRGSILTGIYCPDCSVRTHELHLWSPYASNWFRFFFNFSLQWPFHHDLLYWVGKSHLSTSFGICRSDLGVVLIVFRHSASGTLYGKACAVVLTLSGDIILPHWVWNGGTYWHGSKA